ncbi:Metallo-dependent phosphatase [Lophium mytilinum]|uniref:Metallo-dependent phosphatase n=1 Tax=Lophium mytilinum TaxID=390894 RepID=A0A6A6R119_9PEZI|nr:Metallo-dependent phosphatase [Lophium mytilinum]
MPPPWKRIVAAPASRLSQVPRRVQRYFVIYATLLLAAWVSWKWVFQPDWDTNRAIENSLNEEKVFFGSNMRPEFSDMIQIKTMDSRLLPTDENFKQRLVIVGDVHGCKDELQALLDKVKFRAPHDHLILTGDMISKGPDSAGVVSLARSLSASCVRGNHEDRMLLALADMRGHHAALPGPAEDPTNGRDLLDEESFSHGDYTFRSLAREFDDKQIKWLQACPVILRVGEIAGFGEMVVVHAGLVPGIPLERQDPYHVMNMRTIDLDTRLPSENREGTPWEKLWNKYQSRVPSQSAERSSVVYGHDSKRGKNIHKYSFGLDSGCVAGGRLTALVIEAGRKGEAAKTSTVDVKCKTHWQKS